MYLQDELNVHDVFIQPLNDNYFRHCNINVDVLRLDKIHPVVSGNKWFKLKYWLQDAAEKKYKMNIVNIYICIIATQCLTQTSRQHDFTHKNDILP